MDKISPSDYFSLNNLSVLIKRVEHWNYLAYRPDFEHKLTIDTLWDRQTRLIRHAIKEVSGQIESFLQKDLEVKIAEMVVELCYKVSIYTNVLHRGKTDKFIYSKDRVGQHDQLTNSYVLKDTNFDRQRLELKSLLLDLAFINELNLEDGDFDLNDLLGYILELLIRIEIYKYPNMVDNTRDVLDSKFSMIREIETHDEIDAERKWIKETIGRDDIYVYKHGALVIFKDRLGDVLKPSYYKEPNIGNIQND